LGRSGAKLIWGGEAVAVRHDGRANPNQLMIQPHTLAGLENLRSSLISAHVDAVGSPEDLLIGLQLTHSGRFARPNDKKRWNRASCTITRCWTSAFNVPAEHPVMTDDEIDDLIADFVIAASRARELGFDFVDIKHCHGYLGHEFLSSRLREGRYGGSLRTARASCARLQPESGAMPQTCASECG
jgi:NADPH2 dehydrogenase